MTARRPVADMLPYTEDWEYMNRGHASTASRHGANPSCTRQRDPHRVSRLPNGGAFYSSSMRASIEAISSSNRPRQRVHNHTSPQFDSVSSAAQKSQPNQLSAPEEFTSPRSGCSMLSAPTISYGENRGLIILERPARLAAVDKSTITTAQTLWVTHSYCWIPLRFTQDHFMLRKVMQVDQASSLTCIGLERVEARSSSWHRQRPI